MKRIILSILVVLVLVGNVWAEDRYIRVTEEEYQFLRSAILFCKKMNFINEKDTDNRVFGVLAWNFSSDLGGYNKFPGYNDVRPTLARIVLRIFRDDILLLRYDSIKHQINQHKKAIEQLEKQANELRKDIHK